MATPTSAFHSGHAGGPAPAANLLLLIAVLLPPKALDVLGPVVDERTVLTPYGESGPLALRVTPNGDPVWVQPYTGLPTRTDPRATIYAAKQLGVQRVLNWDTGIAVNPVLQRGRAGHRGRLHLLDFSPG